MTVRIDREEISESPLAPVTAAELLLDVVRPRTDAAGRAWLESVAGAIRAPLDRAAFAEAFTVAARRVGKAAVAWSAEERARLAGAGVRWPLAHSGVDELSRGVLVLRAAEVLPPGELEGLVDEAYRRGDTRERQAVLRTLALLPDPGRFLALAVDACRTSIQPLFEAIACENAYPAAHFPEPSFNQMVLKALFTGVPLSRVLGLRDRVTDELRRMAADYASERRVAGRSVPADIGELLDDRGVPT